MSERDLKDETEKDAKEVALSDDDVYFFNPWDEALDQEMKRDPMKFDF